MEVRDGANVLGTALVAGDGTWSVSVTLAGDGAHSLTARDTDAAGNIGTSDAVGYTLNSTPANTAPTITSNGGGVAANLSVAENGTVVTTVVASDPELQPARRRSPTRSSAVPTGRCSTSTAAPVRCHLGPPPISSCPAMSAATGSTRSRSRSDGHGGTDTQAIAVTVTNASEPTVGGDALNYVINGSGNNQTVALTRTTITNGPGDSRQPERHREPDLSVAVLQQRRHNVENIAGATAATYTPTGVNLDRPVDLVATYTDVFGAHTVTSRAAEIGDRNNNTLQGTTAADLLVPSTTPPPPPPPPPPTSAIACRLCAGCQRGNSILYLGASTTASFAWTGNTLANTITAGGALTCSTAVPETIPSTAREATIH